ncbi:MAG TPA: hydantoinase/oxoprolinase family protein, partial [Dehalococcoidia bacterium]|nr:hydantoinase/oxoprolinase family protein [Dehalococcoidia bacterium]
GASPGPACYDLGGEEATVTDADLVLGYLDPAYFLGGQMSLNEGRARQALEEGLGRSLGIDVARAAWGVYRVVNANMVSATQVYGAERGVDLRRYSLLAFGGAGPVHACGVAEQLGIGKVIIPFGAGLTSAFGLLVTPPAFDFARSFMGELEELDWEAVQQIYGEMGEEGRALLRSMGVREKEMVEVRTAEMRYVGQSHEISVPLPPALGSDHNYVKAVREAFAREYERIYHRVNEGYGIEALVWRASVRGPKPRVDLTRLHRPTAQGHLGNGLKGRRRVYFPEQGGYEDCPVYDRYGLDQGIAFPGPAIVEEVECTTVVGPGWQARVDEYLNLVLTRL